MDKQNLSINLISSFRQSTINLNHSRTNDRNLEHKATDLNDYNQKLSVIIGFKQVNRMKRCKDGENSAFGTELALIPRDTPLVRISTLGQRQRTLLGGLMVRWEVAAVFV
ncbi:unnamed protein product [Cochlearia groenlandica]